VTPALPPPVENVSRTTARYEGDDLVVYWTRRFSLQSMTLDGQVVSPTCDAQSCRIRPLGAPRQLEVRWIEDGRVQAKIFKLQNTI
jgi:hypothetical protein